MIQKVSSHFRSVATAVLIEYSLGLLVSFPRISKQILNLDPSRGSSVSIHMSRDDTCTSTFATGLELKYRMFPVN